MKFEVEIASKGNNEWLFPPTQERLRGRWDALNVAHLEPGERLRALHQIAPVIPGIRICIDMDNKILSIYDPLRETEEGQRIWENIKDRVKAIDSSGNIELMKRRDLSLVEFDHPRNALKDWMFWCRRGINEGICEPTKESAEWPTLESIRNSEGRRRIDPSNSSLAGEDQLEPEAKLEKVGAK